MTVKIMLGSVEAVDRLIGGDTDFEIELRQGIASEFVKRHLKKFALDPAILKAKQELSKTVNKEIMDAIGKEQRRGSDIRFILSKEAFIEIGIQVREALKEEVRDQVREQVREWIEGEGPVAEWVKSEVERVSNFHFNDLVRIARSTMAKKVAKMINDSMK